MTWSENVREVLDRVLVSCNERLHICSPFVTRPGLDFVSDRLPESVQHIEIWTRLEMRDWITQASDLEALADFTDEHVSSRGIALRISQNLHAKFALGDGGLAAAGSANVTFGGLTRNLETVRLVSGEETEELVNYVDRVRPQLTEVPLSYSATFLAQCQPREPDRAALVNIIREYSPPPPGAAALLPVAAFEEFCRRNPSMLADKALAISTGGDNNNRTGHIHQCFFGAQRFLQENAAFIQRLKEAPPDEDFYPSQVPGFVDAWKAFLDSHLDEVGEAPSNRYAFSSVKRNITGTFGGTRTGGGGWDPPFRTVWPLVARMLGD